MYRKFFILFLIVLGLTVFAQIDTLKPYPTVEFKNDTAYKVLRIVDADTVEILYESKPTKVRLIGVDTPETVHPRKAVEPYGKEASVFTRNLLLGESVYLHFDVEKTDKYGRLLAYLYRAPDGLFVNLEIVRQGYGHAYTDFSFEHLELFRHYEERARSAHKGLWAKEAKPSKSELEKSAADDTQMVYVTKSGTKYHKIGCRSLRKSKMPVSLSEAKKRYSACKLCNP